MQGTVRTGEAEKGAGMTSMGVDEGPRYAIRDMTEERLMLLNM